MSKDPNPFEKYTERYERWFDRNIYAYRSELEAIKKILPKFENGIEIGVGSGRFAGPLCIKAGLDPSLNMLKIAVERDIEVIRGVGEYLPFKKESFDLVLVVTTICFFEDVRRSLKGIYDVIEPGGYMIVGFIDKKSDLGRLYQERKNENVFYREATFYSYEEVRSLLDEVGFGSFESVQTLYESPDLLDSADKVAKGHDKGSFIVIKARK